MKINQLIAFCLFSLFYFTPFLSSQEISSIERQTTDNAKISTPDSLELTSDELSPEVLQAQSCVSSFTNQTVSTTLLVAGCTTLSVQQVTVTNTGNLTLTAPEYIAITGPFEVVAGGRLNIDIAEPPQEIKVRRFYYDDSGNRIRRESN